VARAVHSNSERRNRPLVQVNCAALPVGLIVSELFGHEKGAFNRRDRSPIGRFELAHGGTDLPGRDWRRAPDVQVKLLRVLRAWSSSGGWLESDKGRCACDSLRPTGIYSIDSEGAFRQDLYYRSTSFRFNCIVARTS